MEIRVQMLTPCGTPSCTVRKEAQAAAGQYDIINRDAGKKLNIIQGSRGDRIIRHLSLTALFSTKGYDLTKKNPLKKNLPEACIQYHTFSNTHPSKYPPTLTLTFHPTFSQLRQNQKHNKLLFHLVNALCYKRAMKA